MHFAVELFLPFSFDSLIRTCHSYGPRRGVVMSVLVHHVARVEFRAARLQGRV